MSGRIHSYLAKRGAVYYVKRPVPHDLQGLCGRADIRKSLNTHCSRTALISGSGKLNTVVR